MIKTIPQVLRERRIDLGWTQADLADILGVRQSTISEWETEVVYPRYDNLLEWTNAVGVVLIPIPLECL